MATQAVRIELPEEIYQRLEGMASATQRPLEEVIFQAIRGNLPPSLDDLLPDRRDLVADLQQLNDDALWAVAKEPLPVQRWRRHRRLLRLGEQGALTPRTQAELALLREETDQLITRRSYALALLKWRGYAVPTTA